MKLTKSKLKELINEAASEYVWGVKAPGRVANQYRISVLELKGLINEEVNKLFEQPDVSPASHKPNVTPAGSKMDPLIDAGDIEDLERKTKEWQEEDDDITKEAERLGVSMADPYIVGDFEGLTDALLQMMMDVALDRYRQENQPPPGGQGIV
tara:strand:- start:60 stop:518 length:459 start_codon:yes stop_codon:yes gene_type:complete